MRETRIAQAGLYDNHSKHEFGFQLKSLSRVLDEHTDIQLGTGTCSGVVIWIGLDGLGWVWPGVSWVDTFVLLYCVERKNRGQWVFQHHTHDLCLSVRCVMHPCKSEGLLSLPGHQADQLGGTTLPFTQYQGGQYYFMKK